MQSNVQLHFSEPEIVANVCRESFFTFVQEFWDVVINEAPVWNWHIPYLCNIRQAAAERVISNRPKLHDYIVNIAPGSTKSTIFSVLYQPWVWTRMPTARFINASYTEALARELSMKSRDVVRSEKYRKCFPYVKIRKDMDTKSHFKNVNGGMRYSIGTGGSVIGMHGHFLDVDDPIDPDGAYSKDELGIINRWMAETLPSRKVDKRVSVMTLIMQRLSQDDPTGAMLEQRGRKIKHICIPAELSSDLKPSYLESHYQNGLFDPIRLSRRVLEENYNILGPYGYACQYMQTPIPRAGGPFQIEKIQIGQPPSLKYGFKRLVRYWDKAATGGGGAFTVGLLMGLDNNGKFWVLDVIRVQYDAYSREMLIKQTAQLDTYDVKIKIEQEPGSGGKESAEATVRNLAGFRVEVERPHGKKEMRADPYSAQVNAGNVSLAEGAWNSEYLKELRFFPNSKYKDQVDASSGAFADLVSPNLVCGAF